MIEVKYFGAVAEKAKCSAEVFSDFDLLLDDFIANINQKYQLESLSFRVAVNQKIVAETNTFELQSNDVVALLPPFAGG